MKNDLRSRAPRWLAALALAAAGLAPVATASPAAAATDACGTVMAKDAGGTWRCTFVDDFDGRRLDPNKWIAQDSSYSGFTIGGECYDKDRNIALRRGALVLSVTQASTPFHCPTPLGGYETRYMGATVSTQGKFAQTYGRFEARMKFSTTKPGLHGGFWMNPAELLYGQWPLSGEIDVAEYYSSVPDYVFPSLHYAGETGADTGWWTCPVIDVTRYHTYAVEWSPEGFDFIYDGKVCFSRTPQSTIESTTGAPFDRPFFQVLSAGVGGGANAPVADSPFPETVTVDYVRTWS